MATIYLSSVPSEFGSYRKLLQERVAEAGHRVLTRDDLKQGGTSLLQQVDETILKSDVVICLMGERYGEEPSDSEREARGGRRHSYAQWEFLLSQQHSRSVHVFYADDDTPLDKSNDEQAELTKLQEAFLADEVVAKGIECTAFHNPDDLVTKILSLQGQWPQPKDVTFRNPYVGLRRFEEADRDRFFGREALTRNVSEQVEKSPLTVAVGDSGAGKSSLIRAGVIPAWRKKHPEGKVIVFHPDRAPFESLAGSLRVGGFDPSLVQLAEDAPETVFRDLRMGSSTAADPMGIHAKPAQEPWLIFLDQFEELFTRSGRSLDDEECLRRFVASVVDAVQMNDPGLKLVLAMRDDFFGCLRAYPDLYPLVDDHLIRIPLPSEPQLREMIQAPARANGVAFEQGLAAAIMGDVAETGGTYLPQVQCCMSLLWDDEGEELAGGLLHTSRYHQIRGLTGAIPTKIARYYEQRTKEEKRAFRNMLLALVRFIEVDGVVRAVTWSASRSELLEKGGHGSEEVLRQLISEEKLFVIAEESHPSDPMIELVHESILGGWDRLESWIEESREAVYLQQQIRESTRDWESSRGEGKSNGRASAAKLWRGGKLARALEFDRVEDGARHSEFERIGGLSLLERDFLKTSRDAERRIPGLMRKLGVTTSLLGVLAMAGLVVMWQKRPSTKVEVVAPEPPAESTRTQAGLGWLMRSEKAGNTSDAGIFAAWSLGFEGLGKPANWEGEEPYPRLIPEQSWGREKSQLALRRVAGASLPFIWSEQPAPKADGTDSSSGEGLPVAWSPDGNWIAAGGSDGKITIWEVATGKVSQELEGHTGSITSLAFHPGGGWLATGGSDHTIRLWQLADGSEVAQLTGHEGWVSTIAFRPDGGQLASGGYDETVRLWQIPEGQSTVLSQTKGFVYSVSYHPGGTMLAVGGEQDTVQIWDVESGELMEELEGHSNSVNAVSFDPSGRLLATGGGDHLVKIWEVNGWKETSSWSGHSKGVTTVSWRADGRYLASGGSDCTIRLWNLASGEEQGALTGHADRVMSLVWGPGTGHLLSGCQAGTAKLWDVSPAVRRGGAAGAEATPAGPVVANGNWFVFVQEGWVQFDPERERLVWSTPAAQFAYLDENIQPETWIGVMRSDAGEEEKEFHLYRKALEAENWETAQLLSRELLPVRRREPGPIQNAAAQALAKAAQEAPTRELMARRIAQGRALVAWHDAWKRFDPNGKEGIETLVALHYREPEPPEEPVVELPPEPPAGEEVAMEVPEESAVLRAEIIEAPTEPEVPAEPIVHEVKAGENPSTIARSYGITMSELMEFNEIDDPRKLQIGAELKIPVSARPEPVVAEEPVPDDPSYRYHKVRPGENPSIIARRYGTTELELMQLNGISDPRTLQIGARLKIPNDE